MNPKTLSNPDELDPEELAWSFGLVSPSCQGLRQARRVYRASLEFAHMLRRLRKGLTHCRDCRMNGNCDELESLLAQVQAEILEISQEWLES